MTTRCTNCSTGVTSSGCAAGSTRSAMGEVQKNLLREQPRGLFAG